eukprot:scaffold3430_cov61-Phaeocystis_antarctica.AAC.1
MCCSFCVDVRRTVAYGFLSPHDPVNSGSPTVLDILMYFTLRGRQWAPGGGGSRPPCKGDGP